MNRIANAIANVRERVSALDPEAFRNLDSGMDIDFSEHFKFQEIQSQSHAAGALTLDEAQVVYLALGEVGSQKNGGWAEGTDLATKVVVTQLMSELLAAKIKLAQARKARALA